MRTAIPAALCAANRRDAGAISLNRFIGLLPFSARVLHAEERHLSISSRSVACSVIVGYSTKTLADDCQAVSVGFVEVGGAGINLTSLKLNVDGACYGDIYIELLNGAGRTTDTYSWYQGARGKDDGWYNDDDELIGVDVDDVVFTPGMGLWLTGINGEVLTTAGKVYQADLGLYLLDDSQMLGNPYAAPIKLAENIEVVADGTCYGDIYIEMLSSSGRTTDTYSWYQGARGKADGWYNDDDELIGNDVADITFPVGQGLWVTGIEDAEFNITSPIPVSNN